MMNAVFSNPGTVFFSGRHASLKTLLSSVCGKNVYKFGWGGSTEQLRLLSSNCALVTKWCNISQLTLVFISASWPIFLLLSKITVHPANSTLQIMEAEQIMEGQPQVLQEMFYVHNTACIKGAFSLCWPCVILQVPENPHSEYGLTENVEVTRILLL